MKRSGELKRTSPLRASSSIQREAKPAKGPRLVSCKNRDCRARFVPDRPSVRHCSPECLAVLIQAHVTKQRAARAKAERAADRKKLSGMKTLAERAEPVRKLAQRYAVLRDHDYGCISCDKGAHWTSGKWHGSHFKSVGSNSALQFNLWNINKACDQCNYFMAGNIGPYETRLRQKYGDERVDWLKNHPREREYSQDYLDRLTKILRKKIRRVEKSLGIR